MPASELNEKQKRFVNEYLKDLNGTRAYKAAYDKKMTDEVAKASASRLLTDVNVLEYLAQRMAAREKRTEITQDRVLMEYAKLGFFDPRKLFHDDGHPKDISELDDETAAALSGLDVQEAYDTDDNGNRVFVGYVKKYKLSDKKGALDSIARHLGMFDKDTLNLKGDLTINWNDEYGEEE